MDMIIKIPNNIKNNNNLTLDTFRGAAIELNKFLFHFKGTNLVNNHKIIYSHYKQNEFFENDDDLEDEQILLKKHIEISLNNYHQNKLLKKHKYQFSHNLKIKRTKHNCFITLVSLNLNKTRFNNTSITYKIKYKRRAFKYLMWKLQKKLKIDLYKLTQKKGLLLEIDGTRVQLKKWRNFFTRKKLTYSEYVPAFKWHKKKRRIQKQKKTNKQLRYKIKFFYKQKKALKKKLKQQQNTEKNKKIKQLKEIYFKAKTLKTNRSSLFKKLKKSFKYKLKKQFRSIIKNKKEKRKQKLLKKHKQSYTYKRFRKKKKKWYTKKSFIDFRKIKKLNKKFKEKKIKKLKTTLKKGAFMLIRNRFKTFNGCRAPKKLKIKKSKRKRAKRIRAFINS